MANDFNDKEVKASNNRILIYGVAIGILVGLQGAVAYLVPELATEICIVTVPLMISMLVCMMFS